LFFTAALHGRFLLLRQDGKGAGLPLTLNDIILIEMFTSIARSLFRTEDSIATPCSVNAKGEYFECWLLSSFK